MKREKTETGANLEKNRIHKLTDTFIILKMENIYLYFIQI